MKWALHLANVFILCSFLVRDLIVLRLLSIGAGILFCIYFYYNNMMEPIIWNVLFSVVNVFQIVRQCYQARKIPLNQIEQFLQERFFPTLTPLEIRSLYQQACTTCLDRSESVKIEGLGLVVSGSLKHKQQVLQAGNFIGTYAFLSRQDTETMIQCQCSASYICWEATTLRQWTDQNIERHNLLLKALSKDLLQQVKA